MNNETRKPYSFDGFGINGPDEHRTRIAVFSNNRTAEQYGKRFEARLNACEAISDNELTHGPVISAGQHSTLANQRDELAAALAAFLRAPSIGSSGPGSVTIEVHTFNLNAARAILAKVQS